MPSRIRSIDGLRALSIGIVLAGDPRQLGTRCFLVISGFLVTTLLLREHARTGTIALRAHYTRRVRRIVPAAAVFALAAGVATLLGALHPGPWPVAAAATWLGFTLAWPLVTLAAGPRRIGHVAIALAVLAPLLRARGVPTPVDAIAMGAAFAAFSDRIGSSLRYQRYLRSDSYLIVPAVVALCGFTQRPAFDAVVGFSLQALGLAMIVDRCVRRRRDRVGAILNARPVMWLGWASYSLYLWHLPLTGFPVGLGLALAFGTASYFVVERPFRAQRRPHTRARAAIRPVRSR